MSSIPSGCSFIFCWFWNPKIQFCTKVPGMSDLCYLGNTRVFHTEGDGIPDLFWNGVLEPCSPWHSDNNRIVILLPTNVSKDQTLFTVIDLLAVEDPGFPRAGGANPRGAPIYYLTNFSRKMHENKEILAGGAQPSCPLRSATGWLLIHLS